MSKAIHIGNLIKTRRKKLGISQGKIAKALGHTSPQFISNIERGVCACPVPMIKKIGVMLNLHVKDIWIAMFNDWRANWRKEWKAK